MTKLKVDFFKCQNCEFQTTLINEANSHKNPAITMTMKGGKPEFSKPEVHSLINVRTGEKI